VPSKIESGGRSSTSEHGEPTRAGDCLRPDEASLRAEVRNRRLIETSQDVIWESAIGGLPEVIGQIRRGETSVEKLLDPGAPKLTIRSLYVSPAIERMLGFTQAEALALPPAERFTPRALRRVYQMLAERVTEEARGNPVGPIQI